MRAPQGHTNKTGTSIDSTRLSRTGHVFAMSSSSLLSETENSRVDCGISTVTASCAMRRGGVVLIDFLMLKRAPAIFRFGSATFAQLGTTFLTRLPATPLPAPYVVGFSAETAALLGLDPSIVDDPGFAEFFSGNTTLLIGTQCHHGAD